MQTRPLKRSKLGGLLIAVALLLALVATTALAATQTRDDPSDAPAGTSGKADLRKVDWDVNGAAATLSVSVDASTDSSLAPADIDVHVFIDADGDGIADHEIVATRNVDGVKVDLVLRVLDQTLSTADCQDRDGISTAAQATVATTVANGLETFTFAFDPTLVPGGLAAFRWAAFGQVPPAGGGPKPWDVMPDTANPDPAAANPGDRRCDSGLSGLSVRMSEGFAFPDPALPPPTAPSNQFTISKLKLEAKKGVAKLKVEVPGAGQLDLSGKEVKRQAKQAVGAGPITLAVKLKRDAKKDLAKHGRTKVRISLTFTPTGGEPSTQSEKLKLKQRD